MKLFRNEIEKPKSLCKSILIDGDSDSNIEFGRKILVQSLINYGLNIFSSSEKTFDPNGYSLRNITASPYEVYGPNEEIDLLICLSREAFERHKDYVIPSSIILYDRKVFEISSEDLENNPCEIVDVSYSDYISRNNLSFDTAVLFIVSAALCVFGVTKEITINVIQKLRVLDLDSKFRVVEEGYDFLIDYQGIKKFDDMINKSQSKSQKYLMNGSESLALGFIKSGVGLFSLASNHTRCNFVEFLDKHKSNYNYLVETSSDSNNSINMAIGASLAGARPVVYASSSDFASMIKGINFASANEIPLVAVINQHAGILDGLPASTSQSELLSIIFSSNNEAQKIVLTPTDAEECFYMGFLAQNLAEKYQVPVIILIDNYLSDSLQYFNFLNRDYRIDRGYIMNDRLLKRIGKYRRYESIDTDISARTIFGQKTGGYAVNSYAMDERGNLSESITSRINLIHKRSNKLININQDLPEINLYGNHKSKIGFVCFGSTKGVLLEVMRRLENIGIFTKLIAINCVYPFPGEALQTFLSNSSEIMVVENNFDSQLSKLISMNLGQGVKHRILKYDGRPFYPKDIIDYMVKNIL